MKKVGIFCLGRRRQQFIETITIELSRADNKNYHFYLLGDDVEPELESTIKDILGDECSVVNFDPKSGQNYLNKLKYAIEQNHEFTVKCDEDCLITSGSWDRFLEGVFSMRSDDLLYSGVVSNGIPTVELFLEHHASNIKNEIYDMFNEFKFTPSHLIYLGIPPKYTDYFNSRLDVWDPSFFYKKVSDFNFHYRGIHPARMSFEITKKINDFIIENFNYSLMSKNLEVIRDNNKYPYICNSFYGIKTQDLRDILSRPDLFVDVFDEVPINKYRHEKNKNLVFDCGVPVLHTMYNLHNFSYENELIETISGIVKK